MSSIRLLRPSICFLVLGSVILFRFAAPVYADPKPLSKQEQAKVDKAVARAIAFLKRTQTDEGRWHGLQEKTYPVGYCALPAYALLEAGVSRDDPVIQKAAKYVRERMAALDKTYEISLAILLFDRLGDPKDEKLIQTLSLRLIAGQYYTGGWSYYCPTPEPLGARDARIIRPEIPKGTTYWTYRVPLLKLDDEEILLKLLGELSKRLEARKQSSAKVFTGLHVPSSLQYLMVFQDRRHLWREPPPLWRHQRLDYGCTDNSNTQFAMLALWVAQRHGIPVRPTFNLMVERFERSQSAGGWWAYDGRLYPAGAELSKSMASMICVGLLGLGIGRGLNFGHSGNVSTDAYDQRILISFAALYQLLGVPTGQMEKPAPHESLYFLWTLERLCMLYNLPTLGDKEWYRWGAEDLVTNQEAAGEWSKGAAIDRGSASYGSAVDTAFALLFLKRSHPMKDLTPKLPYKAKQLNQEIARLYPDKQAPKPASTVPSRYAQPDQ